jgi:hypothetical protein
VLYGREFGPLKGKERRMKNSIATVGLVMVFTSPIIADVGVRFNKDSIEIELENQKKVIFGNNYSVGSEAGIIYSYRGYYQSIGYHKISWEGYESRGDFALINGKNGKVYNFSESEPILNELQWAKKYTPYIAVSKNGYHGPSVLSIYAVTDSLHFIWDKVLPNNNCWEFGRVIWTDTASFRIEKITSSQEPEPRHTSVFESVRLEKGKWILGEKWKTDTACKWISPKSESSPKK